MWLTIILGGLSLDITAVGQFMISRPIVVGPLAGAVLGAPGIGLAVGALVELIWIGDLPVGAHMPIDNTLLAGVATYLAAEAVSRGADPSAAVTFALCVVLPLAALSSYAENYARRLNGRWVKRAQTQVEAGRIESFERTEILILAMLFTKGHLVAAFSLGVAYESVTLYRFLPPEVLQAFSFAPWFLMVTGCAAAIDLLVEPRRILLLAVAAVVSALLILFFNTPAIYLLAGALFVGLITTVGPIRKAGGTS
jgi:PTS system mannose-specific IIC component